MRFGIETYQDFIRLVRNHPCLYDSSMPEHKDTRRQKNIWMNIAKELDVKDMDWNEWKKLWKQKRDSFTKKRRELAMCESLSEAKQVRKGPLYEHMTFLLEHVSGRSAVSNLADDGHEHSSELEYDNGEDEMEEESDAVEPDIKISTTSAIEALSSSTTSRRTSSAKSGTQAIPKDCTPKHKMNTALVANLMDTLKQRSVSSTETSQTIASKLEEDDDVNIFNFLSKRVKTFSKPTQEWMEDEVLRIFMEAKRREKSLQTTTNTSTHTMLTGCTQTHQ